MQTHHAKGGVLEISECIMHYHVLMTHVKMFALCVSLYACGQIINVLSLSRSGEKDESESLECS